MFFDGVLHMKFSGYHQERISLDQGQQVNMGSSHQPPGGEQPSEKGKGEKDRKRMDEEEEEEEEEEEDQILN